MRRSLGLFFLVMLNVTLASPVVLLGDRFATKDQAWVASLEQSLRPTHTLINLSIKGMTTGDALLLIDAIEQKYHPALLILVLGWADGFHQVPVAKVTAHWTRILQKRQAKSTLIFTVPLPSSRHWPESYRVSFNRMIPTLALDATDLSAAHVERLVALALAKEGSEKMIGQHEDK